MPRKHIHLWFAPFCILIFVLITVGFDIAARAVHDHIPFSIAASKAWNAPAVNAYGLLLLSLPVIGAELLAVEFAHTTSLPKGTVFLVVVLALLGGLYFAGYLQSREALAMSRWTDASLAIGLLPLKGALVLVIPLALTAIASKTKRRPPS